MTFKKLSSLLKSASAFTQSPILPTEYLLHHTSLVHLSNKLTDVHCIHILDRSSQLSGSLRSTGVVGNLPTFTFALSVSLLDNPAPNVMWS
jgi:hypothetical protein